MPADVRAAHRSPRPPSHPRDREHWEHWSAGSLGDCRAPMSPAGRFSSRGRGVNLANFQRSGCRGQSRARKGHQDTQSSRNSRNSRPPGFTHAMGDLREVRRAGGAEEDRTPDLCSAIAALSHLSYSPAPQPDGIGPMGSGPLRPRSSPMGSGSAKRLNSRAFRPLQSSAEAPFPVRGRALIGSHSRRSPWPAPGI